MKVKFIILLVVMIFTSCENNFDPNAEYKESFAVNALLRGDGNFQTVTIVKSINPSEFQTGNNETRFIENANVKVISGNQTYLYKDSLIFDSSNNPVHFYYNKDIEVNENENFSLEVELPNGEKLTAATYVPRFFTFEGGASNSVIDPTVNFGITVQWRISAQDLFFHPQLYVNYSVIENGVEQFKILEIPNSYIIRDGKMEGKFSEPSSLKSFSVDYNTFAIAMESLRELTSVPSNIKIYNAELVLKVYDENLTKYYSSTNVVANAFSSRVYGSDYSNINGGLGIFASYMVHSYRMLISTDYIKSFGYSFVEE